MQQGSRLRLCAPPTYRQDILKACHEEVTAGRKKTDQIKARYYWPKLEKYVLGYVQTCVSCQSSKSPLMKPQGYIEIIRVERPFKKVGIDVLGPFPVTSGRYRNINLGARLPLKIDQYASPAHRYGKGSSRIFF